MRKIAVAFTAVTLALSMLAQAVPAAAAAGFDSAYAGESAFVSLAQGQSNEFQVFFANTGSSTWTRGTSSQVDLAACLADKVTCNAQDASESTWNAGWLSATRYATTTQTSVAPGSIATFKYTVTAPTGVLAGTYRFNGDTVLSTTGERIHPEGYFQDATVGGSGANAAITTLTPSSGPAGTPVTIAGSGFVCTPAFPTVSFDTATAAVLSCGASSLTVTAPAHALGAATVTVTNSGAGASNGLAYTYTDTTSPTFLSFAVTGDVLMVTFDEPVCGVYGAAADWQVKNISSPATDYITGSTSNIPACTAPVTTFSIFLAFPIPNGAFVETTLLENPVLTKLNANVTDKSLNKANAPQSRQATATPVETTKPTLISASGAVGQSSVTLTFSEPVWCASLLTSDFTIDNLSSTTDPTVSAIGTTDACGGTRQTADTTFNIILSANLAGATSYNVQINASAANKIKDAVGNPMTVPTSVTFTSGAVDFTPPTMVDARLTNNAGPSTDFVEANDAFTVTFSEQMNNTAGLISLQDQDGTTATINCAAGATCVWDTTATKTVLTVTLSGLLTATAGSTPGMQIPFNITALTQVTDLQGNPPNVLGSSDRLVDYE